MASGQPDVERNLGRLSHGAHEQQDADRGDGGVAADKHSGLSLGFDLSEYAGKVHGSKGSEDQEYPEHEAEVPDPIDDKGLLAGIGGTLPLIVEADQQVGTEPDSLPTHEHDHEVVGQDQRQHRKHEEVHVSEEAAVAFFVSHVSDGIDVDQESHAGDNQDHHRRQWIQLISPLHQKLGDGARAQFSSAGRNPGKQLLLHQALPFRSAQ